MPAGRPLKFSTPEEIWDKASAYFSDCKNKEIALTITGLALALDTSRQTLLNYEEKDEFFDTIKKAKLIVENYAELRLFGPNPTGPIFALKNFGWDDKQQQEHSGAVQVNWPLGKSKLDE